ncbi:MAG: flagellar hook-basal body complex protein [Candidatus Competibacter sp.]
MITATLRPLIVTAPAADTTDESRLALTNFPNVNGLKRIGDTQWAATTESGTAITDAPGAKGLGTLTSGELESSNVDLATELVDLIVAQRDFNANSKSITAGKEMIQTVINI